MKTLKHNTTLQIANKERQDWSVNTSQIIAKPWLCDTFREHFIVSSIEVHEDSERATLDLLETWAAENNISIGAVDPKGPVSSFGFVTSKNVKSSFGAIPYKK